MNAVTTPAAVLVNFRDEPLGAMVADQLLAHGLSVVFSEELNYLEVTTDGHVLGGLHARSWNARKQGISLPAALGNSLDIDHLLACCDRVFLQPQAVSDLLGYLGALGDNIANWLLELNRATPVIFMATPHFPSDLLLALLAQAAGHPVFVARTSHVDQHIWFGRLFGTQLSAFADFGSGTTFRQQMGLATSRRLEVAREINAELKAGRRAIDVQFVRRFWRRICRLVLPDKINRILGIQPLRRGPDHYWSHLGRFKMAVLRLRYRLHLSRLRRHLRKSYSREVPEKYIYVPLHFQPERSTNPEGGAFRNQIAMVKKMSELLGANPGLDLTILVKEHPRQNHGDIRQFLQRDHHFYNTLCSIPNVKIVPHDHDSVRLIAEATLVASVNGSSAWEALEVGVPALTGVFTWHSTCPASPSLCSVEFDSRRFRELIEMSSEEVFLHVSNFLDSPSFLVRGSISHKHVHREVLDEVATSMAGIISRIVQGQGVKWREVT